MDGDADEPRWNPIAVPKAMKTERSLATVLFTDIVGSTEHAAAMGERAWRELLRKHYARVHRKLFRFGGREVTTAGDGFVAVFDRPARAIHYAAAIRESLRELGLEVRSGLHAGEVEGEGHTRASPRPRRARWRGSWPGSTVGRSRPWFCYGKRSAARLGTCSARRSTRRSVGGSVNS